jgi:hypothetical protein
MSLKKPWTLAQELERFRHDMRANKPMTYEDKLILTSLVQWECEGLRQATFTLQQVAGHTSLTTFKKLTCT